MPLKAMHAWLSMTELEVVSEIGVAIYKKLYNTHTHQKRYSNGKTMCTW